MRGNDQKLTLGRRTWSTLRRFFPESDANAAPEYGVILAVIVLSAIVAAALLGFSVSGTTSDVSLGLHEIGTSTSFTPDPDRYRTVVLP